MVTWVLPLLLAVLLVQVTGAYGMPEIKEAWVSNFVIACYFEWLELLHGVRVSAFTKVVGIWADATLEEQREALSKPTRENSRIRAGLVTRLDESSTMLRGRRGHRRPIWLPSDLWNKIGRDLGNLVVENIWADPRNVTLDFGFCCLQIQLLTHTLPQVYTIDDWYNVLAKVPKDVRAFKIGMALEFRAHVIAFTTLDLLVGIHWAPDRNSLPNRYIDIYENPLGFLYVFLRWIDHQLQRNGTAMRKRQLPVVTLIRSECQLFAGIGVYTLCEILYLAGLSPFMREYDLFCNASRVARFVAAYRAYAVKVHVDAQETVRRCVREWKVAVNTEIRKRALGNLHVFGKDSKLVSKRLYEQLELYNTLVASGVKEGDPALRDPFDPKDLEGVLLEFTILGELIFGRVDWQRYLAMDSNADLRNAVEQAELDLPAELAEFRRYYRSRPGVDRPTLWPYEQLFVPENEMTFKKCYTSLFKINGKQVWTLLSNPPVNRESPNIEKQSPAIRRKKLGTYVVTKTNRKFVGPTDYAGAALRFRRPGVTGKNDGKDDLYVLLIDYRNVSSC